MLDPLITIPIANHAIQFAQFGIQIVEVVSRLHRSNARTRSADLDYDDDTCNIRERVARIQAASESLANDSLAKSQAQRLRDLSNDCKTAAGELAHFLETLKQNEHSGGSETFTSLIKSVWDQKKFTDAPDPLKRVKEEAKSEIKIKISESLEILFKPQSSLSKQLDDSAISIFNSMRRRFDLALTILMYQTDIAIKLHGLVNTSIQKSGQETMDAVSKAIFLLDSTFTVANWGDPMTESLEEILMCFRKLLSDTCR